DLGGFGDDSACDGSGQTYYPLRLLHNILWIFTTCLFGLVWNSGLGEGDDGEGDDDDDDDVAVGDL
nr:hypothetical protein [Tanacetum cinerariifolium]